MGAPKGNKNGHGVKGRSGRKSKYQELADAVALKAMFFGVQDQEKVETKIRKGKFSLRDRFLLNGMEGDSRVLTKLIDKLYPDGIDVTSGGDAIPPLLVRFLDANPDDGHTKGV